MSLSKSQVTAVSKEMEAALKPIIEKYGFQSVRMAGGDFSHTAFMVKFEVRTEKPENDITMQKYFEMFGLPANAHGKVITLNGRQFTITGVDPKKVKYPILASCNNKGYKLPAEDVRRALGVSPKNGLPTNTLVQHPVPGTGLSDGLKAQFELLASQLSPENLHIDGEATPSQVAGRKGAIMSKWRALERQAGRIVPLSEFPH